MISLVIPAQAEGAFQQTNVWSSPNPGQLTGRRGNNTGTPSGIVHEGDSPLVAKRDEAAHPERWDQAPPRRPRPRHT